MTPASFRESLALLRWTQRGLARALGRPEGTVRQWARGDVQVPDDVATWLEAISSTAAELHARMDALLAALPPPRRKEKRP